MCFPTLHIFRMGTYRYISIHLLLLALHIEKFLYIAYQLKYYLYKLIFLIYILTQGLHFLFFLLFSIRNNLLHLLND